MRWSDVRKLRDFDKDDYLKMLGLEERTPTGDFFSGLGLFAVGVLVGAGLGLLFAPKRGEEIRSQMGEVWKKRGRAAQDFARDIGVETGPSPSPMTGGPKT